MEARSSFHGQVSQALTASEIRMILKLGLEIKEPRDVQPDLGLLWHCLKKALALDGNKPDYIR
jgi:hypothetical protein